MIYTIDLIPVISSFPVFRKEVKKLFPWHKCFYRILAEKKRKHFQYIDQEAVEILQNFPWNGNVRELRNAIERVVLLNDNDCLKKKHLIFLTGEEKGQSNLDKLHLDFNDDYSTLINIEAQIVQNALSMFKGSITQAAKYLKTSRNRIYKRS